MKKLSKLLISGGLLLAAVLLCACIAQTKAPDAPIAETITATGETVESVMKVETSAALTPMPTPTPSPVPTPTPTPEPTPTPTPSPTPVPTPFTVVWMSDTQVLSRHFPDVFNKMRDWILENREEWNIVFFAHTGDVVDGASIFMWEAAEEALMPILNEIPSMVVSGNHDVGGHEVKHSLFLKRPYAQAVFREGQTFEDGLAAYVTFEAAGEEFLVFGIGYEVRGSKLKSWISEVSREHPDATVLYVIHAGLQPDGRFTGQARDLVLSVIPENPKARLMLCGHERGSQRRTDRFDDDGDGTEERTFTTMMFNYQDDRKDGLGYVRLLTFDPMARTITVRTYSPWFDQFGYKKAKQGEDAFVLEDAF